MKSVALRRSSRNKSKNQTAKETNASQQDDDEDVVEEMNENNEVADEAAYQFEGVEYKTYQDMVDAKRRRNQQVLLDSGLLSAVQDIKSSAVKQKQQLQQGLRKRKKSSSEGGSSVGQRRKSNRLAGIESDGRYVEDERAGRFSIAKADGSAAAVRTSGDSAINKEKEPEYYRDRINDGSALSIQDAVEHTGPKWLNETSVANAERFVRETLAPLAASDTSSPTRENNKSAKKKKTKSPTSVTEGLSPNMKQIVDKVKALRVDNDECVAKVTPDRIYGIAAHPSTDKLVVCAGDKQGYVGIWNVDSVPDTDVGDSSSNDGVHLFRFHRGAASCLQWTGSGSALFSASYDGTVRYFDVASESFEQIFATYGSQKDFKNELGHHMDTGYHFYTQYGCLDHRFNNEKCFFLSTSIGTAMHVDLRAARNGRVTFYEELSERKINSLSLHPNGYSLLSGGLDGNIRVWDIRKFGDSRSSSRHKAPRSVAYYNCGRSVNSAFYSPSGQYVVTTTMADRLDLFENIHQAADNAASSMIKSIRHDNKTGRWLSTFMAKWHPELDIFCVGSMQKPRQVDIFNAHGGKLLRAVRGDALTAVVSRCCFHPSTDRLTLVGGNSSGRVTIVR